MDVKEMTAIAIIFGVIGFCLPDLIGINPANGQEIEYVTTPNTPDKVEAVENLDFELGPYQILKPNQNIVPDKYTYDATVQASTQDGHDVTALLTVYGNMDKQCLADIREEVAYVILESDSSDVAIRAIDALTKLDSESDRCEFTVQGLSVFTLKE